MKPDPDPPKAPEPKLKPAPAKPADTKPPDIASASVPDTLAALKVDPDTGLVPVVEPEVLMDGDHTLERCRAATEEVLRTVFNQLNSQRALLEGMILKPNMVLPGLTCPKQESVNEVANVTVKSLWRTVPAAVPGIAFLSGGQSAELASARLNTMNLRFNSRLPWALASSDDSMMLVALR